MIKATSEKIRNKENESTTDTAQENGSLMVCQVSHQHADLINSLKIQLPKDQELDQVAEFFKVFGDLTRMKILTALLPQEMCVCEISDLLGLSQSAISHQLRMLRNSRLVKNRREGKSIYYSLDDSHVATIIAQGLEHTRHKS